MTADTKVAIVTGASKGLGREIARLYAGHGYKLALAARGSQALGEVAAELGRITDVISLAVDVAEDAERLVDATLDRFGRIDVIVNNASELGPSPMPNLEDLRWWDMERILRVNVTAPLHLAQLVLPQMRARGEGVIINVSSDAAVEAYPGWGGYGASKAALEHLSRILAEELKDTGVRVYVVDPGDMNTEMHGAAEPGVDLSHLPGPDAAAPEFLRLVEEEPAAFGRFQVQSAVVVS